MSIDHAHANADENLTERETFRFAPSDVAMLDDLVENGPYRNKSEVVRAGVRAITAIHQDSEADDDPDPSALTNPRKPTHAPDGPISVERVDFHAGQLLAAYRVGDVQVSVSAPAYVPRAAIQTALPEDLGRRIAEARATRQAIAHNEGGFDG